MRVLLKRSDYIYENIHYNTAFKSDTSIYSSLKMHENQLKLYVCQHENAVKQVAWYTYLQVFLQQLLKCLYDKN